jgi:hypothetical protein
MDLFIGIVIADFAAGYVVQKERLGHVVGQGGRVPTRFGERLRRTGPFRSGQRHFGTPRAAARARQALGMPAPQALRMAAAVVPVVGATAVVVAAGRETKARAGSARTLKQKTPRNRGVFCAVGFATAARRAPWIGGGSPPSARKTR